MKTHRFDKKLLAGSVIVIWLGAVAALVLSTAVGAQMGLVIGAMAGVIGMLLTVCALALVQIARAMTEIARSTAVLAGQAHAVVGEEEVEPADDIEEGAESDDLKDLPKVVGRIEPRLQPHGRVEPPLYRPGSEAGGLRAVRS